MAQAPETSSSEPSELDLVFCMDCTGSMGSYIAEAQRSIVSMVEKITAAEKADVQFAFVAYRDHPPQDSTFITKVHSFTSSPSKMRGFVMGYNAQGGGDGPEAVTSALDEALNLPYRKNAVKIVVIIADAPPHGLGESGDGFPNGPPDQKDPIAIAKQMAERGIVIYSVGCEPSLSSSYKFAHDFFEGICEITEGKYLPLTSAELLPDVIIGGAQEELTMQRLEEQIAKDMEDLKVANPKMTETEMADTISKRLESRGVKSKKVEVDDLYGAYDRTNIVNIKNCSSLAETRKVLKPLSQPAMKSYSAAPSYSSASYPAAIPSESIGLSSSPALVPEKRSRGFTGAIGSAWKNVTGLFNKSSPPSRVHDRVATTSSTFAPSTSQQSYLTESVGMESAQVSKVMRRVQNKSSSGY